MIPRGVFDIQWSDLRFAAQNGIETDDLHIRRVSSDIEQLWDPNGNALACLSVRTGWDLVLQALEWPPGSEILMSAVTIRDLAEIVRRHQLVPVPLDVDADTLSVDPAQLSTRISPQTRGVLIAHLFGSRSPLQELAAIAHARGLLVFEDCAQAYAAMGDRGDPHADVSFFSFGLIKAQTALGGGLIQFRDPALLNHVRQIQATYPRQSAAEFRRRIRRCSVLHILSHHAVFTALVGCGRLLGADYDRLLSRAVRGFGGRDLLEKIRRQPSWPMLNLLRLRLARPNRRWLLRKSQLARIIREELPLPCRLGIAATFPTHWVLPVRARNPDAVCRRLIAAGYDATRHASNMTVIDTPSDRADAQTPMSSEWVSQLVYLPLHPCLSEKQAQRLGRLVCDVNPS